MSMHVSGRGCVALEVGNRAAEVVDEQGALVPGTGTGTGTVSGAKARLQPQLQRELPASIQCQA